MQIFVVPLFSLSVINFFAGNKNNFFYELLLSGNAPSHSPYQNAEINNFSLLLLKVIQRRNFMTLIKQNMQNSLVSTTQTHHGYNVASKKKKIL